MKRFVLILILCGTFHEVSAQKKVIDTVWFRVAKVDVVDKGLLNALNSMSHVFCKGGTREMKELVWYIRFDDEDSDSNSENKVDLIAVPSYFITPVMRKSDGYFYYKNSLFLIEKRNEARKANDSIFKYSNKRKSFYYLSINWDIFWGSSLDESIKSQLLGKYCITEDFPSVFFTRKPDGVWIWQFSLP